MQRSATTFERRQALAARVFVLATLCALVTSAPLARGQTGSPRGTIRLTAGPTKKTAPLPIPRLDLAKLQPRKVYDLRAHTKPVNRVAFNFDGSLLASGGDDGKIIIWDMKTGAKSEELTRLDFVWGLAFAPQQNGTLVSVRATPFGPGHCGALTIHDLVTSQTVEMYSRAAWSFLALAIHRSGTLVAAGGADRALHVWDLSNVVRLRREGNRDVPEYFEYAPPALPTAIRCLDFYPKKLPRPLIVVGCKDGWVKLYEIANPQEDGIQASKVQIEKQSGMVNCVKFSPDGRLLATAGVDGLIRLRNAINGEMVRTIDTVNSPISWLSFSPDSQLLADARDDKTVRLWNVATGKELAALHGHMAPVRGVEFGSDGKRLASCDRDFVVIARSLFPPEPVSTKKNAAKKARN